MKVLLLNGSPHQNGCTHTALTEVSDALQKDGIQTELFWIGVKPVYGCTGCGGCGKTGQCVLKDDVVNTIIAMLPEIDGLVVGSPVHYAAAGGAICCVLDRLFYAASRQLAFKPGAAVVSCRRGGASAAFDRLNKYFTINHMPVVSSQYWNSVHGYTPDDVRQDLEGLQTMRALGHNMAWLLHCIEAGRAAGVTPPQPEPRLRTNFIR